MNNPLDVQVDGTHYKWLKIQPVQFAMANGLDPCAFSILKYVTRHRTKNGLRDIEKADHFRLLRVNQFGAALEGLHARLAVTMAALSLAPGKRIDGVRTLGPTVWMITPESYCEENGITGHDRDAILHLGRWVEGNYQAGTDLMFSLKALRREYEEEALSTSAKDDLDDNTGMDEEPLA